MGTYKNIALKIDKLKYISCGARNSAKSTEINFDKADKIIKKQNEMWKKLKFLENLQGAITNGKKY